MTFQFRLAGKGQPTCFSFFTTVPKSRTENIQPQLISVQDKDNGDVVHVLYSTDQDEGMAMDDTQSVERCIINTRFVLRNVNRERQEEKEEVGPMNE